jgi:ATP-dependent DNA helicase UvrD/PcrA
VFVLNVSDGCIPSDMAAGSPEQIEEERRLLYVAMTRARHPLGAAIACFRTHQHQHADGSILSMRSRFLPDGILDLFERRAHGRGNYHSASQSQSQSRIRVNVAARMREMWN